MFCLFVLLLKKILTVSLTAKGNALARSMYRIILIYDVVVFFKRQLNKDIGQLRVLVQSGEVVDPSYLI